jgi:lipoprotein-releasing system permease protein
LYREGLLISHGKVKGAVLKGIDPLTFSGVYDVKVRLLGNGQVPANIKELLNISGEVPALVLGADLAEDLGINQPGETVKVFLPKKKDGAAAKSFQVFKVTGTFSTGLYEYDHGFAFVDLSKLQKIFDVSGMATGIEFKLNHPEQAEEISKGLKPHLGQLYDSVSWQKLNAPLFRALRLERIMFFVIMSMVVAVAAFNIVGVLLLMIFEKSREISILRALGASYFGLKRVFGIQGLVLGALGSLGGMILGGFLVWILKNTHFLKLAKEVYLVGEIPVDFSLIMVLLIVGASLVITFLATQIGVARLKKVPLDL